MRTGTVLGVLLLLTVLLSSPHPARAGTIQVGGSMTFTSLLQGSLHLEGERGFTLDAGPNDPANIGPFISNPVGPGMPIPLDVIDNSLGGTATLDGISYCVGSSPGPCAALTVFITGNPLIAPPLNVASLVSLTNPVQFTGLFFEFTSFSQPPTVETLEAIGSGTVTLNRIEEPLPLPGFWDVTRVTYDLQPIPEPSTLLLWSTTMAGLGLAWWRRRRAP